MNFDDIPKTWWKAALYSIHYIINDLVLLVFNLVIDIILVVRVRKNLKKKEHFSAESTESKNDLKKKRKSVKNDTNKIIIYQVILFLICRFPELIFYMHFLFFSFYDFDSSLSESHFYYAYICTGLSYCYYLANVLQFLYNLSYSVSVYFLYKFNKSFNQGFRHYVSSRKPSGSRKNQARKQWK